MKFYAVPKRSIYLTDKLQFEQGKSYEIVGEIEGKYAVSYGFKGPMVCSTWPKEDEGDFYDVVEDL